jgi:hypothetical protein
VKVNPKGTRGSQATTAPAKAMERAFLLKIIARYFKENKKEAASKSFSYFTSDEVDMSEQQKEEHSENIKRYLTDQDKDAFVFEDSVLNKPIANRDSVYFWKTIFTELDRKLFQSDGSLWTSCKPTADFIHIFNTLVRDAGLHHTPMAARSGTIVE